MTASDRILMYVASFLAILVVMPAHEFAHAFVAYKCGDDTARVNGRLTLNPFAHFDVAGLIMLVVAHFGWAKPVPINPYNFNHLKRDYILVSIAGVVTNYVLAFLFCPLMYLAQIIVANNYEAIMELPTYVMLAINLLQYTLIYLYMINLNLVVFNLIPVFPLDGFRVLEATVKNNRNSFVEFLRTKGCMVLMGLILISVLADYSPIFSYIDVFGWFMNFMTGIFGFPITAFWGWIFGLFA